MQSNGPLLPSRLSDENKASEKTTKLAKTAVISKGRKRTRPVESDSDEEVQLEHPPSPKKPSSTKIQPKKKVNRAEVVITRRSSHNTESDAVLEVASDNEANQADISSSSPRKKQSSMVNRKTTEVKKRIDENDDDDISSTVPSTPLKSAMKSKGKVTFVDKVADKNAPASATKPAKGKGKALLISTSSDEHDQKMSETDDDMSDTERVDVQAAIAASISAFQADIIGEEEKQKEKDFFNRTTEGSSSLEGAVYLEDLYAGGKVTSDPPPAECEVLTDIIKDPLLRKSYEGLPKLWCRTLRAWNSSEGTGYLFFSVIQNKAIFPDIAVSRVKYVYISSDLMFKVVDSSFDTRFIKSIVTSTGRDRSVNPSRIDPSLLAINPPRGGQEEPTKFTLSMISHPKLPALCYSVVCVGESHVQSAHSIGGDGKYSKSITAKLFTGEFERFVSTLLMAVNLQEAKAQLYQDWLSFTCRPLKQETMNKREAKASTSQGVPSPATSRLLAANSTASIQNSIGSESTLCILDGRDKVFDIEKDIFALGSKLPRFSGEIPHGSIALLGYVPAVWGSENLSLSLNWAVVLATPSTTTKGSTSKGPRSG